MSDIEKRIEELNAKHAKAIADAKREHAIALALPVALADDERVTGPEWAVPWVTYKRETLGEACDVMRAFTVLPAHVWRSGCTLVKPESVFSKRERKEYGNQPIGGPFACSLHVGHIPESPGPTSAQLVFFAEVPNIGPLRVSVKFGRGYIGTCPALAPRANEVRGGYRNRVESRTFDAQPDARALSDYFINWASGDFGPVKTSANQEFLFMSEGEEATPGAECQHALGQLQNLADILKI